jgi:hypothetical protein
MINNPTDELALILAGFGDVRYNPGVFPPNTIDELIVLIVFSPFHDKTLEDRRWKVPYQTMVWCI